MIAVFTCICRGVGHISKSHKPPPQPKYRTFGQKTHAHKPATHLDHMNHVRKQSGYRTATHHLPTLSGRPSFRHRSAPDALRPDIHSRQMNGPCFQDQRIPGTKVRRTLSRPPHTLIGPSSAQIRPFSNQNDTSVARFQT